ncbi:MAG: 50S ribosomal protein L3 [Nanoarchaeota archaeon]|nr:50S ribosomal protein L3 [Nanoarchaeota archaeon]
MTTTKSPRKGSLQFWPRKKASKFLPSVNWEAISGFKPLKGFICYKAGMASAIVKDSTPNSMTKDKKISVPVTILECPPVKIFSVRFYKNRKVMTEILANNLEKELKRKIKLPKKEGKKIEDIKDYDDVRVIVYSIVKKTGLKKRPDLAEVGIKGSVEEKIIFVKEHIGKEILASEAFEKGQLIDARGLTKGKGFSGPVKRFGIKLRSHKAEKGLRKVGSIGPWHPARVTFRVPMAGQLGMFTRAAYNSKIIEMASSNEKPIKSLKNYGDVKTNYIIVQGSVQGSAKRQLIITAPLRETKQQNKKKYEFLGLSK